jgi:hypothetical protein
MAFQTKRMFPSALPSKVEGNKWDFCASETVHVTDVQDFCVASSKFFKYCHTHCQEHRLSSSDPPWTLNTSYRMCGGRAAVSLTSKET